MKVIWNKINWLWAILVMLGGAVFSTYLVQYLLLEPELFEKLSDKKWMLNIICVLVVYLVMLFITIRVNISAMISHSFFMVLAFVNYYVYLFRENEFIFADIRSIGTGLSVAGNYKIELSERGWYVIIASAIFFLVVSLFRIRFKQVIFLRVFSGSFMLSFGSGKDRWNEYGDLGEKGKLP